jgi:hypothetical protein
MKLLIKFLLHLIAAACMLSSCAVADSTPSLSYDLKAKAFDKSDSAQLLVTADVPGGFSKLDVQLLAPPGFMADPNLLSLEPQPGKRIIPVTIRRAKGVATGDYSILAHATAQPSVDGVPMTIDQVINFAFIRRLPTSWYFALGLAGFVIGYLIRLVSGVLQELPKTSPAPSLNGARSPDGPITQFIKDNRYKVDFFLSMALAFVVLLYALIDGHPPDTAAAWSGALLSGIGLGFLANNDLLAKIKV